MILALYFQILLLLITGDWCIEYAGSECLGIVSFDLWNETNFIATDFAVRSSINILPMYLVSECTRSIRIFECFDRYAPLNSNSSEQQPCLDVCSNVFDHCQDVFQLGYESEPGQIIFLLQLLKISGCPQSTSITGVVTNSTVAVSGPCISLTTVDNDLAQFPQDETTCPYGMVPVKADSDYPIPTTGCALRCTGVIYSDDEINVGSKVLIVAGLISFVGLMYVMFNQYQKLKSATSSYTKGSHFNIIMFCSGFAFTGFIVAMTELIGGLDVDCDSDSKAGTSSSCLFEGYMMLLLTDWSMGWCAIIVLELYFNVFSIVNKMKQKGIRKYYPLICAVLPISAAITMASVDGIGALIISGVPMCFAKVEPQWCQYAVFFAPVSIVVLLIIYVAVSIAYYSWQIFYINLPSSQAPDSPKQDSPRRSSKLTASLPSLYKMFRFNSKIITLAIMYFGLHIFLISTRIDGTVQRDEYKASIKLYIECLLKNSLSSASDGTDICGLHSKDRLSYGALVMILLLLGGYGVIPFFSFGLDDLISAWKRQADKTRTSMSRFSFRSSHVSSTEVVPVNTTDPAKLESSPTEGKASQSRNEMLVEYSVEL